MDDLVFFVVANDGFMYNVLIKRALLIHFLAFKAFKSILVKPQLRAYQENR